MDTSAHLKRTIIKENIYSNSLGVTQQVRIYLPPGFNELISYPILYCQDGQDIFMYGRIATISNYLILEEDLQPFIIVGVDVDKKNRTNLYSPTGSLNDAYNKFFVSELVPYIEDKYVARQSGISRILIGDSLGATVSLHIALDYPDVFQHVISLSGAYFEPSQKRVSQETNLNWLHIWMLVGLQETSTQTDIGEFNFLHLNQEMNKVLLARNARVNYLEEEGKHIWGFWQKYIATGISYFLKS